MICYVVHREKEKQKKKEKPTTFYSLLETEKTEISRQETVFYY